MQKGGLSCALRFLETNMPASVSLPQALHRPSFLNYLRHRALLAFRKEKAARKNRENHVQQTKKVASFITRNTTFVTKSASWLLLSTYLILILRFKLILSNNQSNATLWVLIVVDINNLQINTLVFSSST